MPILNQRAILLVKQETTSGTDAGPVVAVDAIMVINPEFTPDVKMLDRKFASADFSDYPAVPGRKMSTVKFSVELAPTGIANTPPKWTRLLLACGMSQGAQVGTPITIATSPTGAVCNAGATILTFTTLTAHGATAGNVITVAGVGTAGFNGTYTVLTAPTGTTLTVGNTNSVAASATSGGGTLALVAGQLFLPATDSIPTVTLWLYYGGFIHKVNGAAGTFSIKADAGTFGEVSFTFTGQYNAPVNGGAALPTGAVYDTINPAIVEYSNVSLFGLTTVACNAFKLDIGNKVVERGDMNYASGFRNTRIADRKSTGGLDPEMEVANDYFARLAAGTLGAISLMIGGTAGVPLAGTSIYIAAPQAQISAIKYADRDNFRVYDLSFALRRSSGNDEFSLLFT